MDMYCRPTSELFENERISGLNLSSKSIESKYKLCDTKMITIKLFERDQIRFIGFLYLESHENNI